MCRAAGGCSSWRERKKVESEGRELVTSFDMVVWGDLSGGREEGCDGATTRRIRLQKRDSRLRLRQHNVPTVTEGSQFCCNAS